MIEPAVKDLSTAKKFATLSFHLPSGDIASHVMWVDADDEHMLINTERHRIKYRSMTSDGPVTVTVWDLANPYRYVEVRGVVDGEIGGDEARAHIDELSQRYLGHDYSATIQSERVILKIRPERQRINL